MTTTTYVVYDCRISIDGHTEVPIVRTGIQHALRAEAQADLAQRMAEGRRARLETWENLPRPGLTEPYTFGADVTRGRAALGVSQAELARRLGVDVMTVSRWERGVVPPPPYLIFALEYLLSRGEGPKAP